MGKVILLVEGLLATWFVWRGLYPDFYYLTDVTALVSMWTGIAAIGLPSRRVATLVNVSRATVIARGYFNCYESGLS